MSEHELLYNNKFINTNVDGIRNDEKENLLSYLDEIENERNNQLRKEKSKIQKLREESIEQKVEYRKTLVNVDSRLRNKYPVNIKDAKIHRLQNTKYQIIDSIRLIKENIENGIINYIADIALKENINLATNIKLWLSVQTWNNYNLNPYEFYINYYDFPKITGTDDYLYHMQNDLINHLDLPNCYITIANVKYTITAISIVRINNPYDIIYRSDIYDKNNMIKNFIQLKITINENSSILDYLVPENQILVKLNKVNNSGTAKTDAILHDFDNIIYKIAYPYGPGNIKRFFNISNVLKDIISYEKRYYINIIINKDTDFTQNGIFEVNKSNSFMSILNNKFNIVYIECFDITGDNTKLLLKIQFLILKEINKFENIISNLSNINISITKKGFQYPLTSFNKTLYLINSYYTIPYLQIRTNSNEFKYDPTKNDGTLINLNDTIADYNYYDIPNFNILKMNTYFFIHMITLINNTSDIQITHPNHGLKMNDKISVNLQQINKLYGKGGLIEYIDVNNDTPGKLTIYTEHDILRTFNNILDRDNYYNDYTILRKDMPDKRCCFEIDILNISTNVIKTHKFENVEIFSDGTTYSSKDFNDKIYNFINNNTFTNEINNFAKLKFHIETSTSLTDIDGTTINFTDANYKIIQSYNNTWYSYHINSNFLPFYTIAN